MTTFTVESHENLAASATSESYARRILLQGADRSTGQTVRVWLRFERVPSLYELKQGLGVATAGGLSNGDGRKYWVYLPPSSFDQIVDWFASGKEITADVEAGDFPGLAVTKQLVTSLRLEVGAGWEVAEYGRRPATTPA